MVEVVTRRRRPAPEEVAAPKKIVMGVPLEGGPVHIAHSGHPVFTGGKPINVWPYVTGSRMIGWVARERHPKQPLYHIWTVEDGVLRYRKYLISKEAAKNYVYTWNQNALQPVAVVRRVRAGQ